MGGACSSSRRELEGLYRIIKYLVNHNEAPQVHKLFHVLKRENRISVPGNGLSMYNFDLIFYRKAPFSETKGLSS